MTTIRVTVVFERTIQNNPEEEKNILANFNTDDVLMMFHCIGGNTLVFPSAFQFRKKYADIQSSLIKSHVTSNNLRLIRPT